MPSITTSAPDRREVSGAGRGVTGLLVAGVLAQIGWRAGQVVLPLVALSETGSVWATGLVGGASGVPVLLAPWWTAPLRRRIRTASRIGALELGRAAVTVAVPTAAVLDILTPLVLVLVGLGVGVMSALSVPARSALLANLGDLRSSGSAAGVLVWQDTGMRIAMILGPTLGGVIAASAGPVTALALDTVGFAVAGVITVAASRLTPSPPSDRDTSAGPRIRDVLRTVPDLARGWWIRGTGCFLWFAFSLGVPLLGASAGSGTPLAATGFAGYGVGGLVGSLVALRVVRSPSPLLVAATAWSVGGLAFVAMGAWPATTAVAVAAACAGAAIPAGNATITALITRATTGAGRSAALTGQQTVVTAASTAGLLVGGPLIGVVGARTALVGAGLLIAVVALAVVISRARLHLVRSCTGWRD